MANTKNLDISKINTEIVENYNRSRKVSRFFFCTLSLVLLSISFCRLPYTGCYLDAIFFEYLFGAAKYFVYAFLLTLIIFRYFNQKIKRIFFNKKALVFEILMFLFILVMTSACSWLIGNHKSQHIGENFIDPLIKYHTFYLDYFKLNGFTTWFSHFVNSNITGGLIGEFFVSLSFIMQWSTLFIFELIILVVAFVTILGLKNLKILTKIKRGIVHMLGGELVDSQTITDELKGDKKSKVHIFDVNSIKMEASNAEQFTPPLSFLADTSIDHTIKNRERANKCTKQLNKFLKEKGIKLQFISFNIMPLFTEYTYKSQSEEEITKLFHAKSDLLNLFKTRRITILLKGSKLTIEIENSSQSRVSIKSVLTSPSKLKKSNAAVGCASDSSNILYDFDKNPSALIVGKPGSGAIMQVSSLIVSNLYINTPNDLRIMLCSPQEEKVFEYFSDLSHLLFSPSMSYQDVSKDNNGLIDQIKDRLVKFSKNHCKTLDDYNEKNPNEKLPKILYVLFGVDEYLASSPNNSVILKQILSQDAINAGIRVIMYCNSIDSKLLDSDLESSISSYFVFKTNNESVSEHFLNSAIAVKLFGNGDGYMLLKSDHSKTRIQSCYINKEEMTETIKIINAFYKYKTN